MTPADGLRRALRHLWHPATTEAALEAAAALHRPVPSRVISEHVVVARTDTATMAFPDRCLHRSIPLSAGTIVDDVLVCAGHAWRWGADGRCVGIPDLAPRAIPARARLDVLDVAVVHGLVWVRLEAAAATQPPRLGDASFDGVPMDIPVGAARVVDLLLHPARWLRMLGLEGEAIGPVRVHESGPGVIAAHAAAGDWAIEVELHVPFATHFRAQSGRSSEPTRSVVIVVAPTDDHASRIYWQVSDEGLLAAEFAAMVRGDGELLVGADSSPSMLAPGHELSVTGDGMSIAYRRAMADLVAAARQGPGPLAALVRTA